MESTEKPVARRGLNPTAASLLGFLHDGPLTGWDLVATAQRVIGDFWSLTPSQVYRELTTMATAGLIEAGERGTRDRRPFALTPTGRAAFADWLDRPPAAESIRFPLLLTISFARHLPPYRLAEFLREHRAEHARRLAGYTGQLATWRAAGLGDDPFAPAALEFGIRYEQAVVDWFDALPAPAGPTGDRPTAEQP